MKAALYARVSTTDKDQNTEVQLSKLRDYCQEMGWIVCREYVDGASAADFLGRVGWKHLMKDAALHKFDVLLVWKIDRAFRSVIHAANTLSMLRSYRVGFRSYMEPSIDTTTPHGEFIFNIMAAVAELLRPARGGFLRPFGCGWFIREFLSGHGPEGSLVADPDVGAPQADIFYQYKTALLRATALDRATRAEERKARREKCSVSPDNIERLTKKYLARMPYKANGCRYHSFVVYFSALRRLGWVEPTGEEETRVSHGSIANIVSEIESGNLIILGTAFDQVNDLRQLSFDLKKHGLNPSQALLGINLFKRLRTLEITPERLDTWSDLIKRIRRK